MKKDVVVAKRNDEAITKHGETAPTILMICPVRGYTIFNRRNSMSNDVPEAFMTPDSLKQALKAFRKRLRLTRLDAESKLGGGALSSGKHSGIVAIRPPSSYPPAVWEKLVELGKLRHEGGGLYELTEDFNPI